MGAGDDDWYADGVDDDDWYANGASTDGSGLIVLNCGRANEAGNTFLYDGYSGAFPVGPTGRCAP